MNIFDGPRYKKRVHAPTAPGAGALATGRRGLPSVGTRIFTATPSWRPPGGSTVSLGAISVNSDKNQQEYRALGDILVCSPAGHLVRGHLVRAIPVGYVESDRNLWTHES